MIAGAVCHPSVSVAYRVWVHISSLAQVVGVERRVVEQRRMRSTGEALAPLLAHATARERTRVVAALELVHELILRAGERAGSYARRARRAIPCDPVDGSVLDSPVTGDLKVTPW